MITDTLKNMEDNIFKTIFKGKKSRYLCFHFLSILTGIDEERFLNAKPMSVELLKRIYSEKGKTSDVAIWLDDSTPIAVEANTYYKGFLPKRNLSYLFALYLEATKISSNEYPSVFLINIDLVHPYKKDMILDMTITDSKRNYPENVVLRDIHFILENDIDMEYNKDIKEEDREFLKLFARFLLTADLEEIKKICELGGERFMEAYQELSDFKRDRTLIGFYDVAEREEGVKNAFVAEGRADGLAEGFAKGQAKLIRSMLENGMNINDISKCTSIAIDKIKSILK